MTNNFKYSSLLEEAISNGRKISSNKSQDWPFHKINSIEMVGMNNSSNKMIYTNIKITLSLNNSTIFTENKFCT